MATNRNTQQIRIDVLTQGIERLDQLLKSTNSSMRSLNAEIQKLAAHRYSSPQIKAMAGSGKPPSQAELLKLLGLGRLDDAIANQFARGLDQAIRAMTNRRFVAYSNMGTRLRTMEPSSDRRELEQQIRAMELRVANADRLRSMRPSERNEKIYQNEVKALERFTQARQRLRDMEAAAQREKMEYIRLEERLKRLQDERFAALQREIELTRENINLKRLSDPDFRQVRDQQSLQSARDRERRKVEATQDPEVGWHRQTLKNINEEARIREQIHKIDEKILLAAKSQDEAARARLAVRKAELEVALERNQAERGWPNMLEKAQEKYVQLKKYSDDLVASKKQEKREQNDLARIDKQLEQNRRKIAAAELQGNQPRIEKLRLTREIMKLEQMELQGINRNTEAYRQQEQVVRRMSEQVKAVQEQANVESGIQAWERRNKALADPRGAAELFKIQARLLVNYQVMGAISNTIRQNLAFIPQFDAEMTQLQAITATTTLGMIELEQTIIKVSEGMKFTALEVAQAATVLGQAGFSAREIGDALQGVATLATATGSTLAEAVDVMTAAISVFNMRASETQFVANVVTSAINNSRLTMERFTLGMQYAANTAADAGVSFTEFTAVMAAFANSGIRAGSMLGTGLRQMMIDLQAPSRELQTRFQQLGLSTDDVNISVHGILGVLENLRRAGFTSGDAMQYLQVRAANAFSAISRNAESARELQATLLLSNAATQAADVQLESFSNTLKITDSILKTISYRFGNDFLGALQKVLEGLNSLLQVLTEMPGLLRTLGGLVTGIAVSGFAVMLTRITGLTAAFGAFTTAVAGATGAVGKFNEALKFLSRHPFILGFTTLTTALAVFSTTSQKVTTEVQEASRKLEEASERLEVYRERVDSVDGALSNILQRYNHLETSQADLNNAILEAQVRFSELGVRIDRTTNSALELIQAYQGLRAEMGKALPDLLLNMAAGHENLAQAGFQQFLRNNKDTLLSSPAAREVLARHGAIRERETTVGMVGGYGTGIISDAIGVQELIDEVPASLELVEELLDALRPERAALDAKAVLGNLPEEERPDLEALNRTIGQLEGVLTEQLKRDQSLRQSREQRVVQDIIQTGFTEWAERQQIERDKELAAIQAESIADYNQQAAAIQERYAQMLLRRAELIEDEVRDSLANDRLYEGDPAEAAARLVENVASPMISAMEKSATDARETYAELTKGNLERQMSLLERELRSSTRLGRHTTVAEAQQQRETAMAQAAQLRDLRILHARTVGVLDEPDVDDHRERWLKTAIAEAEEEYRQTAERFTEFFRRFQHTMEKSTTEWEDFGKKLRETERNYKLAVERALLPGRLLDMSIQQAGATPENLRNVSQARIRQMQRERDDLRVPELRSKQEELLRGRESLEAQLAEARAILAAREDELAALYRQKETFGGSEPQLARLNAQIAELENKIEKLGGDNGDISKMESSIENLNIEIAENAHLIAAADQGAQTWAETWATLIDELLYGGDQLKSATVLVSDTLTAGFDATRSSLAQLVQDVLSGTESISEAFRKMAASIIESMLEIAAHELAGQLFGMVVKGITSGFGFGGSRGVSQPTHHHTDGSVNFAGLYRLGGIVRAATGRAVVGRDSKLILAEPGEAILRKSAVDLIGREGFEELNALGNRTVSRSGVPNVMPKPREPDMVNVYVVAPDQVPPPSPKEIVAIIGKDIAQRGPTRQLIKQVAIGAI